MTLWRTKQTLYHLNQDNNSILFQNVSQKWTHKSQKIKTTHSYNFPNRSGLLITKKIYFFTVYMQ